MTLRRLYFTTLACLACSSVSWGQGLWKFGPRVGLQFSRFSGEKHSEFVPGFNVGGYLARAIGSSITLETSVLYSGMGGSRLSILQNPPGLDVPIQRQTVTSKVTLHSIEVPILISYSFLSAESARPRFMAGPSFAALVYGSAKRDITLEFNPSTTPTVPDPLFGEKPLVATVTDTENVTGEYERFNVGVTGGVGMDIPLSNLKLIIDFKYRMGVTPVDRRYNPLNRLSNSSNLRSNSFIFSIALAF